MEYRRVWCPGGWYFFTVVTYKRQPILTIPENVSRLRLAFRHVMQKRPFEIDGIVVMPDHVHCIWRLPEGDADFATRWRLIKHFFSLGCFCRERRMGEAERTHQSIPDEKQSERRMGEAKRTHQSIPDEKQSERSERRMGEAERTHQSTGDEKQSRSRKDKRERAVWQRRYWEHLLRNEDDWRRHMDYIHYNPVKHGLVGSPAEWPHSSFKHCVEKGWYSVEWGSNEPKTITEMDIE